MQATVYSLINKDVQYTLDGIHSAPYDEEQCGTKGKGTGGIFSVKFTYCYLVELNKRAILLAGRKDGYYLSQPQSSARKNCFLKKNRTQNTKLKKSWIQKQNVKIVTSYPMKFETVNDN